jgi:hypothetical protein
MDSAFAELSPLAFLSMTPLTDRRHTVKPRYRNTPRTFRCKLRRAFAVAAAFASVGCYKTTFVDDPSAVDREPTHEQWTSHFLWGVVGDDDYDATALCPRGASVVRTGGNFGTGVVTVATLGIYSPRKIYVTCADGRTASNARVSP